MICTPSKIKIATFFATWREAADADAAATLPFIISAMPQTGQNPGLSYAFSSAPPPHGGQTYSSAVIAASAVAGGDRTSPPETNQESNNTNTRCPFTRILFPFAICGCGLASTLDGFIDTSLHVFERCTAPLDHLQDE